MQKLYEDFGLVLSEEQRRKRDLKNFQVETGSEFELVENLIEGFDGVLAELQVTQRIGNIPVGDEDEGTLAKIVVDLVKLLLDISTANFSNGYLVILRKAAKKHVNELSKTLKSWQQVKNPRDVVVVKKQISGIFDDLIHHLKKFRKSLKHDINDLKKKLNE